MKIKKEGVTSINGINCDIYSTSTDCLIMVSSELTGKHLSISHQERYPTWDEIKSARYKLMDKNTDAIMYLPKESDYVNVHQNCFHVYEVPEDGYLKVNSEIGKEV